MDRPGDQLLAGSALAGDDDRERRVGDPVEQAEQLQHARRPPDDVVVVVAHRERLPVVAQLLFDAGELLLPRGELHFEAAVQRLDLPLPAAQLREQARVLERDRGLLREVEHEADVILSERALAQAMVDVDGPGRAPLDRKRDRQHRMQMQIGDRHRLAKAGVAHGVDGDDRLAAGRGPLRDRAGQLELRCLERALVDVARDLDHQRTAFVLEQQKATLGVGQLDDRVDDHLEQAR